MNPSPLAGAHRMSYQKNNPNIHFRPIVAYSGADQRLPRSGVDRREAFRPKRPNCWQCSKQDCGRERCHHVHRPQPIISGAFPVNPDAA